ALFLVIFETTFSYKSQHVMLSRSSYNAEFKSLEFPKVEAIEVFKGFIVQKSVG
ncbi:MAG: hypothetical protein ACI86H_002946, partial [bacterium]